DAARALPRVRPDEARDLELHEVVLLERALGLVLVLVEAIENEGAERIAAAGRVVGEAFAAAHRAGRRVLLPRRLRRKLWRCHLLLLLDDLRALLLEVRRGRTDRLARATGRDQQRAEQRRSDPTCALHRAPPCGARFAGAPCGALPLPAAPFAPVASGAGSGSGSTKRNVVAFPSTLSNVAVELSLPIVMSSSVMLMIRGSRAI